MKCVILDNKHKQILYNHAYDQYPNESCALLVGHIQNNCYIVNTAYLTQNQDFSTTRFSISADDLIKCYSLANKKQLEVVGIFHSHTQSSSYPSQTDKKFMELNPICWIIFSYTKNDFKAFVLNTNIEEIPIYENEQTSI